MVRAVSTTVKFWLGWETLFLELIYMNRDIEMYALNARQKERTIYVVKLFFLYKRQLFGIIIFVPEVKMYSQRKEKL